MTFTIYYQNTGNDTAFKVVLLDSMDSNLDMNTLEILESSHLYTTQIMNSSIVMFTFENIMLPDSGINLAGSQGFIRYRIKPISGIPQNTQIYNTAYVYFDLYPSFCN